METFLSVLFWIIFVYYLIRIILRYLVPFLLVRFFKKMENRMGGQQASTDSSVREGDIKVNYEPGNSPKVSSDVGEYVDFEEIKDKPKS